MSHYRRLGSYGQLVLATTLAFAATACDDPVDPTRPATIEITPASIAIPSSDTVRLSATVRDHSGRVIEGARITWSSRNPSLLAVDSSGLVTALFTTSATSGTLVATYDDLEATRVVTVDVCQPKCGSWSVRQGMPSLRRDYATASATNTIFVAGGTARMSGMGDGVRTLESYDVAADAWTVRSAMPEGRRFAKAVTVNGILYMLGGSFLTPSPATTSVWSYDPATDLWTTRTPMPTAWASHSVVVNGLIYILGGVDADGDSPAVYAYDPSTNIWTSRAPMPAPRAGMSVAVVNGVIYAFGGASSAVHSYDPSTDRWTSRAAMNAPRSGMSVVAANGRIFTMGGTAREDSAVVEVFDATLDVWSIKTPYPGASFRRHRIEAIGDVVYVVAESQSRFYAYNTATNVWALKAELPSPPQEGYNLFRLVAEAGRLYVLVTRFTQFDITIAMTSSDVLIFQP